MLLDCCLLSCSLSIHVYFCLNFIDTIMPILSLNSLNCVYTLVDLYFVLQMSMWVVFFSPDIDTEKNRVTAEIPYGGFLLFSNMIPHRRYVLIFNFQALLPCMDCYKYVLL